MEATTALIRSEKARALDERGERLSLARRKAWAASGLEPGEVDGVRFVKPALVARNARDKPIGAPPLTSQWHTVRAEGKRTLFERVADCSNETRALRLTCKGCGAGGGGGAPLVIPIGCDVPMFCPVCRVQAAKEFRVDFERKRLGLTSAARRAGLMSRFRRRLLGGRFGERLVTLTVPHEGGVRERVRLVGRAWARFWRLMSDELRPALAAIPSGIKRHDLDTGEADVHPVKRGKAARRARESGAFEADELSLWDLVSYVWVREWTPGADGLGHPHLHVWLFSPFIDRAQIQNFWTQAIADCLGRVYLDATLTGEPARVEAADGSSFAPIVDVRSVRESQRADADDSVGHELVKYLTKEWEIDASGVRRARPEIFAQLYAEVDGRRQRQTSAGLSTWAVKKICVCPDCQHEAAFGEHWARAEFEYFGKTESEHLATVKATGPPVQGPGLIQATMSDRDRELMAQQWEKRDADWQSSVELRLIRASFAKAMKR